MTSAAVGGAALLTRRVAAAGRRWGRWAGPGCPVLFAALLACGGDEPEQPAAPEAPPVVVSVPAPGAPAPASGAEPSETPPSEAPSSEATPASSGAGAAVPIELMFHGVGPLHQGFFADRKAVASLGGDLGHCLADTAQLRVAYDTEERTGRIWLKVPPDALEPCLPRVGSGGVDLAPLQPVGEALAAYRDRVASSFDFRVSSFRIGTSFTRGPHRCTLWAAGQHPPDGTTWSPCIQTPRGEMCGDGTDGSTTRIALGGDELTYVRACFRR